MAEQFSHVDRAAESLAWRRLHRLIDDATPDVRRVIEQAFRQLSAAISAAELERILRTGDLFALNRLTAGFSISLRRAADTLQRVYLSGVRLGRLSLPPATRTALAFDVTSPFALVAAESYSATKVVEITQQTRRAIRAVVGRAFSEQIPPRDLARLIRPLVGLTERQAMAVINRRFDWLEDGLSPGRVARLAERYAETLKKRRALTIARTETMKASIAGQQAAWQAAQSQGLLSPTAKKRWIVTPDDRLCPVCAPLDGQAVPVDGLFMTSRGMVSGPPAHPNCRCSMGIDAASLAARRAA